MTRDIIRKLFFDWSKFAKRNTDWYGFRQSLCFMKKKKEKKKTYKNKKQTNENNIFG